MDSKISMIQIQTTSICPGRCIICPYKDSWLRKAHGYMSDEDYIHVLEEIKSYLGDYKEKLLLYLMNDPFADKKIIERMELAYQYFPKCKLELSTNGLLLTEKLSKRIVETVTHYNGEDTFELWISLQGASKKTWEFLNNLPSKFERTLKNIINYLKTNNGQLKTVINSAGGASRDGSMFFYSRNVWKQFLSSIFQTYNLPLDNVYLRYYTFHNRAGNVRLCNWDGTEYYREIGPEYPFECWRFRNGIHILYDLDIILCCMCWNKEVVLGSLKTQTLKEIWEGETRNKIVEMASGKRSSPKDFICRKCMSPGG